MTANSSIYRRLVNIGLTRYDPPMLARKVRLVNQICLIGAGTSLIFLILQAAQLLFHTRSELQVSFVLVGLFLIPVVLNFKRKYAIARVFLLVDVALVLTVLSVGYGQETGIKYALIGFSILPTLLFDQPLARIGFTSFLVVCFFLAYVLQLSIAPFMIVGETQEWHYQLIYSIMIFMLFVVLFLTVSTFRQDHEDYEGLMVDANQKLKEAAEEIKAQRDGWGRMNAELAQKNEEITSQRDMLEQTSKSLIDTNQNLIASISYAHRIQEGFLPTRGALTAAFRDHFVLLKPRDVVSGDAYYFYQCKGYQVLASIDCTGHGVPGAFITMLVNALLNQVVIDDKMQEPGEMLEAMHRGVYRAIGSEDMYTADGMDMGLVVIFPDQGTLKYAGAKHPLVYGPKGGGLQKIKATSRSIGDVITAAIPFESHTVEYSPGTRIYLFSDGFADQFGGLQGKKFMRKQLLNVLETHHDDPMDRQKQELEMALSDWMSQGYYSQVDDILVMGVELG